MAGVQLGPMLALVCVALGLAHSYVIQESAQTSEQGPAEGIYSPNYFFYIFEYKNTCI